MRATVTISLPAQLAREVDRIAKKERRSRSELFREAFRQYVNQLDRWERIFAWGREIGKRMRLTEADIDRMVYEFRHQRRARKARRAAS